MEGLEVPVAAGCYLACHAVVKVSFRGFGSRTFRLGESPVSPFRVMIAALRVFVLVFRFQDRDGRHLRYRPSSPPV